MKKKIKLFSTIATLCLCLAMMAFGVLSAITVTYKTTGTITYNIEDTYVEIETRVFSTSKKYSTDAELKVQSQNFEQSNFTAINALITTGLVESADVSYDFNKVQIKNLDKGEDYVVQDTDYVDTYSSVASIEPPKDLSLNIKYTTAKDDDEGVYTYFVVTKIVNKSSIPLYTFVPTTGDDKYVAPENSYTYKDEGYNELLTLNAELYVVFAMSLKDVTKPIDEASFVFPISITKDITEVPQDNQAISVPEIGIIGNVANKEQTNVDLSKANYTTAPISSEESYLQANIFTEQSESYSSFSIENNSALAQNSHAPTSATTTVIDLSFNILYNGAYINVTEDFITLEQAQSCIFVYDGKYSSLQEAKNSSEPLTTTITANTDGSYLTLSVSNGTSNSFSIFIVHTSENAEMLNLGAVGYFGLKSTTVNLSVISAYDHVTMPVAVEAVYTLALGSLYFYMPQATVGQEVEFKFNIFFASSPVTQDIFGFTTDTDYSTLEYDETIMLVKNHYSITEMMGLAEEPVMITNNLTITPTLTENNELVDFSIKFNVTQEYLNENGSLEFSLFTSYNPAILEEGITCVDYNIYSSTQNLNVSKVTYTYTEGVTEFELNKSFTVVPRFRTTTTSIGSTPITITTYSFDFRVTNIKSNHGYLILNVNGSIGDWGVGVFDGHYGDGSLVTNQYGLPTNYGSSTPFSSIFAISDTQQKFEINLRYAVGGVMEFCIVTTSIQSPIASWVITGHLEDYSDAVYELKTDSNGNEYYSFKYLRDKTLTSYNMPDTYNGKDVLEIGEKAFEGASNLMYLTLSNKLQTIGDYAFSNLKIFTITIPQSVENIGRSIFTDCNRLVQIRMLSTASGYIYGSNAGIWTAFPTQVIYDSTTKFDGVFSDYDANGIMFYTINNTKYIFDYIGDETVVDLSSYTDVYGLADAVFKNNTKITKIVLPEGLVWIGRDCFEGMASLRRLILSSTVKSIDSWQFNSINGSSDLIIEMKGTTFPSWYSIPGVVTSIPYTVSWTLMVPKGCAENYTDNRVGVYKVANIIEAE